MSRITSEHSRIQQTEARWWKEILRETTHTNSQIRSLWNSMALFHRLFAQYLRRAAEQKTPQLLKNRLDTHSIEQLNRIYIDAHS